MTKYPIIVDKRQMEEGSEEKRYTIYCLAPRLNAFNETIDVVYAERGSYRKREMTWEASKGSSGGRDAADIKLVMEGYAIALRLMAGDESDVTPAELSKKFHKAYWAKQKRRENARWEAKRKANA